MTRKGKHHTRIGKDPERLNRSFWDQDADAYQAEHESQLDGRVMGWGVWHLPEAELNVLGDVSGLDVLEYGCGAAQLAIKVAARGARVTGLDQSRGQLRHAAGKVAAEGIPVHLLCASATAVPLRDESFDLVFCDHGAMSFCDPYRTVPEVARLLRPGGRFAFNISTLLRNLCFPEGDPDAPVTRRLHGKWFGARAFDWGDGTIDFQIPHGEWISLFREHGLVFALAVTQLEHGEWLV
ncbi:MAG: class I SAM-dependent methyltransferase, partial [Acidimicrobiia bacterium]